MIINMPVVHNGCTLPPRPVTNVSGGLINYINGINELDISWELPPVYDVQIGKIGIYGYIGDEAPTKFSQFELITEVSNTNTSTVVETDKPYNYTLVTTISTDDVIQKDLSQMCHYNVAENMPLKESFANMTWENISTVSESGYAQSYFSVGDTKSVTIGDKTYKVAIYDFNHDYLADGAGKLAGMTIGLVSLYSLQMYSHKSSASNSGGWRDSSIRSALQSTVFNKLPEELRNVIKNAEKMTSAGSKSTSKLATSDNLFLFSEVEVLGTTDYTVSGEGSLYEYFKTATNRKKKTLTSADYLAWWLRSPYKNDTSCFAAINVSGQLFYDSASDTYYTCFGFCI